MFRVLRRIEETLGDCAAVDRSDGVRLTWERKWLHVRSSNTEPIMRVVAEAPGEDEARRLADKALVELKRCAE